MIRDYLALLLRLPGDRLRMALLLGGPSSRTRRKHAARVRDHRR
jgi:hypothetical protein